MNLALEIKNIFDKEQIKDRNGNLISDIEDLTAL